MPRKTVLFIAEAVTLAHVARPWVLAHSLDPERYRVVFAVDGRYDALFDFSGMQREALDSIPSSRFMQALAKGSPLYDGRTLESYVEADLALMERVQPDLVVGDFRLSLSISARLRKVPYAAISNIYWSPYVEQHYPVPDLPLTRIVGVDLAQRLFDRVRPLAFGLHTLPLNRVRRRFGLASLGWDLHRTYTDADQVLYADLQELWQTRPLPAGHRFIGPVLWSADTPLPEWWGRFRSSRPTLFATLGSSGKKSLLPQVIEALGAVDADVMVAAAGAPVSGNLPENVRVADYLPAQAAIQRSALLVCNGGSPTTQLALAAGIPCIGIATNLDQFLNMSAIERAGVGVLLRADRFRPVQLTEAVNRLLGDAAAQDRAAALGTRMAVESAQQRFWRFLEEI
jgi:UDP:flavonoid glycosyltransferase YjiC (YdhE family)